MSTFYTQHHLQKAIYHSACARLEEHADGRQHNEDLLEQVRKLLVEVQDNLKGGDTTGT